MGKRMAIMLVITGILFGGIYGYHAFGNYMMKKYFATMQEPPATVATEKAVVLSWQARLRAVGDIRAARGVNVAGEAAGVVASVTVSSGDEVKEGQTLVTLNADADTALLHALEAAADQAQTVYDRDQKQFEAQAVSRAVVDEDAADLKAKRAQVARQEALIAQKTIRAPFDGRVGIVTINKGQYLNPGETVASVQALETVLVDFFLPQQAIARVVPGQEIALTVDAYPGRIYPGKVSALDDKVAGDSRNIRVEATVANLKRDLLPGMFAGVEVNVGGERNYVTLPQSAVVFNPYGETVYLVEEKGKDAKGSPLLSAKQTFVTTGETRGDQIAVMKGLKEGDVVIVSGQQKLRNGSGIVINNKVRPSGDVSPAPVDE